jgi:hypothetical protein
MKLTMFVEVVVLGEQIDKLGENVSFNVIINVHLQNKLGSIYL